MQEVKIACLRGRLGRAWQEIGRVKEKGSTEDNFMFSSLHNCHLVNK